MSALFISQVSIAFVVDGTLLIHMFLFSILFSRLRLQKRGSSSHPNNNGEIVTSKGETIALNKESTTRVTSQFKTVSSLFVELIKTNTPSFDFSLSSLAKRLPFQNAQTNIPIDSVANKQLEQKDVETKTGIPLYFDILGRKKEEKKEVAIPQWKIKRKAVSQESIDARTKHVVSAVAKAVSQSSLLVRLEDFCHHLFQYPAAKSVASRVRQISIISSFFPIQLGKIDFDFLKEGAISILLRLKHSIPRDELIHRQIREGLALLGYADPLPAKGIRILSIDGGGTRLVDDTRLLTLIS
jgi:hypothetical protein